MITHDADGNEIDYSDLEQVTAVCRDLAHLLHAVWVRHPYLPLSPSVAAYLDWPDDPRKLAGPL